jgi:endonuclease-3
MADIKKRRAPVSGAAKGEAGLTRAPEGEAAPGNAGSKARVPAARIAKAKAATKARAASTRLPRPEGAPPVDPALKRRAAKILAGLYRAYPDAHCALDFQSPLDLYVATVLSAQCTDERVNKTTPALFAICRKPEDYLALGTERLEEMIRPTGFFRAKTRNILAGCRVILETFGGELPRTMEELITIPGCGRKTANVILGNAFGIPGITVDTHVQRLSKRLELAFEKDPVKIEGELQQIFPEEDWTQLSHSLIWHGRQICIARRPLCERCPIRPLCPYPEHMAQMDAATPAAARSKMTSGSHAGRSKATAEDPAPRPKVTVDKAAAPSKAKARKKSS